jgi:hypothetical protein
MDELDEKLKDVYDKMDKQKDKLIAEIDKSEARSEKLFRDKLLTLKELIDQSNTARSDQVNMDLSRLKNGSDDCGKRCEEFRGSYERRLRAIEEWKTLNWQRTIIYVGVAIIAVIKVFDWIKAFIK